MNKIEELKRKKNAYIQEKADSISDEIFSVRALTHKISTCDYENWDRDLHYYMPAIAEELRSRGFNVSSSVNYGVTDWIITV